MKKRAYQICKGDFLLNIGTVTSVELFEVAQLVRVCVTDEKQALCLSAAFYWYKWNEILVTK